jgi:hypothetical protein
VIAVDIDQEFLPSAMCGAAAEAFAAGSWWQAGALAQHGIEIAIVDLGRGRQRIRNAQRRQYR